MYAALRTFIRVLISAHLAIAEKIVFAIPGHNDHLSMHPSNVVLEVFSHWDFFSFYSHAVEFLTLKERPIF